MLSISAVRFWETEEDTGRSDSLGCTDSMVRMLPRGFRPLHARASLCLSRLEKGDDRLAEKEE